MTCPQSRILPEHRGGSHLARAAPTPALWRKHDLLAHLHYGRNPRIPAIVCLATPGWLITTHAQVADPAYLLRRGTHAYDNLAPSMRALFIAEGPSFKRRYVAPPFSNVDVYPLLAHILGIKPEANDDNLPKSNRSWDRPSLNQRGAPSAMAFSNAARVFHVRRLAPCPIAFETRRPSTLVSIRFQAESPATA